MVSLVTQISFGGGELAPYLHGRADLGKYAVGLKQAKNVLIRAQGGAYNRPGLQHVTPTYQIEDEYPALRMLPFDVADNDSLILLFGQGIIQFIRFGALVLYEVNTVAGGRPGAYSETAGSEGDIMELATPYDLDDLDYLKFAQSNDIMTITRHGHDVYELRRYGFNDWGLFPIAFAPSIDPPANVNATANIDLSVPSGVGSPLIYNVDHTYVVAAVNEDGEESLASTPDTCSNDLTWRGNTNTITWDAVAGAEKYSVYKAQNSLYGFIGFTEELTFTDKNFQPILADSPKTGDNPFEDADRKPAVVTFHQQRRWFANYESNPQTFDASASGQYANFNKSIPAKDDDAITATIASARKQSIFHMLGLEELLLFTQGGEWKVVGANGDDIVTPSSLDPRPQSNYGSTELIPPIVVGPRILFVQSLGHIIYDLGYNLQQNKYLGDDLTTLSVHMFEGRQIVKWAYDKQHYILWMVMSDGKLVSMTYHREHELWAATQCETDGVVEDVICIPEIDKIVTYFVVKRERISGEETRIVRAVEKLHDREVDEVEDSFFVDAGLSFEDPYPVTDVEVLGTTVRLIIGEHPFVVGSIIDIRVGGFTLEVPSEYDYGLRGQYEVTVVEDTAVTINFDPTGRIPWDGEEGVVRRTITSISGFAHIAGREVVALIDGAVYGDQGELTLSGAGGLDLPVRGARVHLGLGYNSRVETLDIDAAAQTTQGMIRSVHGVNIRVRNSRGIFIGPTFNSEDMKEYYPRQFEPYNSAPEWKNDYIPITLTGEWKPTGLICVEQRYPLPMEILSITPDVEFGNQN